METLQPTINDGRRIGWANEIMHHNLVDVLSYQRRGCTNGKPITTTSQSLAPRRFLLSCLATANPSLLVIGGAALLIRLTVDGMV